MLFKNNHHANVAGDAERHTNDSLLRFRSYKVHRILHEFIKCVRVFQWNEECYPANQFWRFLVACSMTFATSYSAHSSNWCFCTYSARRRESQFLPPDGILRVLDKVDRTIHDFLKPWSLILLLSTSHETRDLTLSTEMNTLAHFCEPLTCSNFCVCARRRLSRIDS